MSSSNDVKCTLHSHCEKCYNYNCSVEPEDEISCAMLNCDLDCGAKFHTCKLSEHKLLCPFERVACLSANCGCPMSVVRCLQVKHMLSCPAFVLQCGQEYRVEEWDSHFFCKKGPTVHEMLCTPILERRRKECERKKNHIDKVFEDIHELQKSKKKERDSKDKNTKSQQAGKKETEGETTVASSIPNNSRESLGEGGKMLLYPEPPKTPLSPDPPPSPFEPRPYDFISNMPTEIMAHVGLFMDGESMYNLAKTSSHMFNLCITLLEQKKGMVYLKWQKKGEHWQIKEPMWHFTSAMKNSKVVVVEE